jgi:foldase protein PrsA
MARRGVGETKKHLARAERERIQRRWILTGTIAVAVVVLVVLGYGIYDTIFVQPYQTVAEVNGVPITAGEFTGRVRFLQRELLNQLTTYLQMESFFGSDPEILQQLRTQQLQIQTQLANPEILGQQVLESMIVQELLKAEAEAQGISVSDAELQEEVQGVFNFFPGGTPTRAPTFTPLPTMTLDPTTQAELLPTETPTQGPSPTAIPTSTPLPTPTAYTLEAYNQDYQDFIKALSDFRIRERDFLAYVNIGMIEQKLRDAYQAEIEREQEHAFTRVILAESEEVASEIVQRLEEGEEWEDLAAEFSLDTSTRDNGGELGWVTFDDLLRLYGEIGVAAFLNEDASIIGPLPAETGQSFLFRIDDREVREMSDETFEIARNQAFDTWVQNLRNEAEVVISEDWQRYLPEAVPINFQAP